MLSEDLEIYRTTNRLVNLMLTHTKNVSKEVKFAEWAEARSLANKSLDTIFLINSEEDYIKRAKLIDTYLFNLFGLRNRIRSLSEAKYLPLKYKTNVLYLAEECKKQAISWKKYCLKTAKKEVTK